MTQANDPNRIERLEALAETILSELRELSNRQKLLSEQQQSAEALLETPAQRSDALANHPLRMEENFAEMTRLQRQADELLRQSKRSKYNYTTIPRFKWTTERYHQAAAAGVFDGVAIELLDGELVEITWEGIAHAGLISDTADYLRELLGVRVKVREHHPVTLLHDSEPKPDLAMVKPLGEVYRTERHPQGEDILWIIEYAKTSVQKDLDIKTEVYAKANIAEYWVVNLKSQELIVFRNPVNGEYCSKQILTRSAISPLSFPEISFEVTRLLR